MWLPKFRKTEQMKKCLFEVQIVRNPNLKVEIPIPFILITKLVGSEFDLH